MQAAAGEGAAGVAAEGPVVFAVTASGVLCAFDATRLMDRWVKVQAAGAFCVSAARGALCVGCTDGVVRVFDPSTLAFRATLPLPPAVGAYNVRAVAEAAAASAGHPAAAARTSAGSPLRDGDEVFPGALALRVTADSSRVVVVYGDRSLFVWDISRLDNIGKYRSFLHHASAVWDVRVLSQLSGGDARPAPVPAAPGIGAPPLLPPLPSGAFVTCSSDASVRVWDLDRDATTAYTLACAVAEGRPVDAAAASSSVAAGGGLGEEETSMSVGASVSVSGSGAGPRKAHGLSRNAYCRELLQVLMCGAEDEAGVCEGGGDGAGSRPLAFGPESYAAQSVVNDVCDFELAPTPPLDVGLRCLALAPDGRTVACGDRQGNIRVFDLRTMSLGFCEAAHDAEVTCMRFSAASGHLLATGSRDRLVHVFDTARRYAHVATLDNHSSSVNCIAFSRDDAQLLTCGGDAAIVYSSVGVDDGAAGAGGGAPVATPTIQHVKSLSTAQGAWAARSRGQRGGGHARSSCVMFSYCVVALQRVHHRHGHRRDEPEPDRGRRG